MAIKTAILGYGRSGSTLHADPLEAIDDFEITAICDLDSANREKASKRFNCKVYDDYFEMLSAEKLDLVVIITRSDLHSKMACDCLRAGVNVLVTKPWALNVDQAKEMISTAKKSGKMLLPWLPARWGCDLIRLKEIIASGAIGEVFQVRRSEFSFGIRHDWQTQKCFGGGYLLNWGPHLIDQPMQLLGGTVKSVYGQLKQVINPGDVEDVFYVVLKMENGALITSEFNLGVGDHLPTWIVQGDRGTIYVKGKHIEITKAFIPDKVDKQSYRNVPKIEDSAEDLEGTNLNNLYGDSMVIYPLIAKAIRGERPYDISLESALYLTEILDAIRYSSTINEVVHL